MTYHQVAKRSLMTSTLQNIQSIVPIRQLSKQKFHRRISSSGVTKFTARNKNIDSPSKSVFQFAQMPQKSEISSPTKGASKN